MDHIAIMNKKWKLINKILTKEKTIESRWYVNKIAPWDKIKIGETIYFKDSGSPITAKAKVKNVIYFSENNYNPISIIKKYGKDICIQDIKGFDEYAKTKNYCILIFLENPEKVNPFEINKAGFGCSCAWLCVDDINKIKK